MRAAKRTSTTTASDLTLHVFPKMGCYASRAQKFS